MQCAGMGYIQSNNSLFMFNHTMISFNMLEVARIKGVKRLAALLVSALALPPLSHQSMFKHHIHRLIKRRNAYKHRATVWIYCGVHAQWVPHTLSCTMRPLIDALIAAKLTYAHGMQVFLRLQRMHPP